MRCLQNDGRAGKWGRHAIAERQTRILACGIPAHCDVDRRADASGYASESDWSFHLSSFFRWRR
jgi:hypothetical protein